MKRTLLILALSLLVAGGASAQRCLPGMHGVGVRAGSVDGKSGSYYAAIVADSYAKSGNRWVWGAEYLRCDFPYDTGAIPLEQFTAEGGYYKHLWSDPSRTLHLSLGASALAGYETLNHSKQLLPDGASLNEVEGFITGLAATLELEGYVTDRLILSVHARERALWGTAAGRFRTQFGVGIKWMFN